MYFYVGLFISFRLCYCFFCYGFSLWFVCCCCCCCCLFMGIFFINVSSMGFYTLVGGLRISPKRILHLFPDKDTHFRWSFLFDVCAPHSKLSEWVCVWILALVWHHMFIVWQILTCNSMAYIAVLLYLQKRNIYLEIFLIVLSLPFLSHLFAFSRIYTK